MTGVEAHPPVTMAGLGQGSGSQIPQGEVPCMVRSHDGDPQGGTIDIGLLVPTPEGPGPGTIHRTDAVTVLEGSLLRKKPLNLAIGLKEI